MCCIALYCILYCSVSVLQSIMYCMVWYGMVWYMVYGIWYGIALHCIAFSCIALYCIAVKCIGLDWIGLRTFLCLEFQTTYFYKTICCGVVNPTTVHLCYIPTYILLPRPSDSEHPWVSILVTLVGT